MKNLIFALAASTALAAAAKMNPMPEPEFVLPEVIYLAPGVECNIYYANIFDSPNPDAWKFQTYAEKIRGSKSWKEGWMWTPGPGNCGQDYQIVINAWSDMGYVSATTTLHVAEFPKCLTNRISIAQFAASKANCLYQDQLMRNMKKLGFVNYTPVGSRGLKEGSAANDACGGWTYNSYLRTYMMSKDEYDNFQDQAERDQLKTLGISVSKLNSWQGDLRRSPLLTYKDGKIVIDATPWFKRVNGGKAPDYLLVHLGNNATFWYKGLRDEVEAVTWKDIYAKADNEITPFYKAVRQTMPNTVILFANEPLGCGQDAYATNYGSDWNYPQQRRNTFALNKLLMKWVKELNDPNVLFVSMAHAIHPTLGYLHGKRKVASRIQEEIDIEINAVHPSLAGGMQLGDALTGAVMYRIAQDEKNRQGAK